MQFIPMGRPSDRLMWITPDRVFHVGLLGALSVRTMGAVMAYVATQGSIRVRSTAVNGKRLNGRHGCASHCRSLTPKAISRGS